MTGRREDADQGADRQRGHELEALEPAQAVPVRRGRAPRGAPRTGRRSSVAGLRSVVHRCRTSWESVTGQPDAQTDASSTHHGRPLAPDPPIVTVVVPSGTATQ